MFGRLFRVTGTVLVIAAAFVTPVLLRSAPASADTVVNGCTIVSNPTATNFTDCPGADLSGANLSGLDLSFANLSGASFANCVTLAGVGPTCSVATLSGANLADANLSGAFFVACDVFPGPECFAASLSGVNLTDANLSDASLFSSLILTPHQGSVAGVEMSGAILSGANLSGANMTDNDLTGATLTGANLTGTVLGDATLTNANLSKANLSSATFTFCPTGNTLLPPCDIGGTLNGADFTGADFTGADLTGTDLTGANLTGANLTGTLLVPTDQTATTTGAPHKGLVVSWPAAPSLPGATPGNCTPPSGSTFQVGTTTVTCQVLDSNGDVATGTFTVDLTVVKKSHKK